MLDASNSGVVLLTDSLMGRVNLWISLLGMFSTVFGIFFAIALGAIALLIWNNIELRKKADKEVRDIIKSRKQIDKILKSYDSLMQQTKNTFEVFSALVMNVDKDAQTIKKLVQDIKNKKKSASEALNSMRKRTKSIDKTLNSLATISHYTPGEVSTEAKTDAAKSVLEKLLWPHGKPDNDRGFQEALRQRAEKYGGEKK